MLAMAATPLLLIKRCSLYTVLACSTTFFQLSLFCAAFFQLRLFMLFISSTTSSSQRVLGLPIGLLDMRFRLLIFCTLLSSAMHSTWSTQFSLFFLINPIIFCPFNISLQSVPLDTIINQSQNVTLGAIINQSQSDNQPVKNVPLDTIINQSQNVPLDMIISQSQNVPLDMIISQSQNVPLDKIIIQSQNVPLDTIINQSQNISLDTIINQSQNIPLDTIINQSVISVRGSNMNLEIIK